MRLYARERERGWVTHSCPVHGDLVVCTIRATVVCKCRKKAAMTDNGRTLDRNEIRRITRRVSASK